MRVATKSLYQGIEQRILTLASKLKEANERVASGKNFSRPSDDPLSMVQSLGLRKALAQVEQYGRNIDTAELWLNLQETVIDQISTLADQAQQVATAMSNGTQSDEIRAVNAEQIGQLLDQAISMANTQLAGKYIFAGYRTSTAPFSRTTSGGIETAQYNGDSNNFEIQIAQNEKIVGGKNGQSLFIDSGLFDALGTLKRAIEDNDLTVIQQQADVLQGVEDSLNGQLADIGVRQSRLEGQQEILDNLNKDIQDRLSDIENVDYNKVILELQQQQTAYEVALEAAAKISQLSLLNYL
jgi:flagellar hook-associated protein 3 FlgL